MVEDNHGPVSDGPPISGTVDDLSVEERRVYEALVNGIYWNPSADQGTFDTSST